MKINFFFKKKWYKNIIIQVSHGKKVTPKKYNIMYMSDNKKLIKTHTTDIKKC